MSITRSRSKRKKAGQEQPRVVPSKEPTTARDARRPPPPEPPLFELVDFRIAFRRGTRPLLEVPRVRAPDGGMIAVVGPSGAGKSTLLHVLAGIHPPTAGAVRVLGDDVPRREGRAMNAHRARVAVAGQGATLRASFTLAENVAWPMLLRGADPARELAAATDLLLHLGLPDPDRTPRHLSGGERQRVAIARAVHCAEHCRVLLLDEPTSSLDEANAARVMTAIRRLVDERGVRALIATHDPRVLDCCDAALACEEGRIHQRPLPGRPSNDPTRSAASAHHESVGCARRRDRLPLRFDDFGAEITSMENDR